MAVAHTQTDVLSRVRREQRLRGKAQDYSGLRIVVTATAITVGILLFAFGAIGMLMMARSPQEPIVSKLDTAPPLPPLAAAEAEQKSEPQAKQEPDVKTVKTQRIVSPAPAPAAELPQQKQEVAVQQPPAAAPDPETTATISNPQARPQQQVPHNAMRQQPQQHHAVRRPVPDSQADNPLYEMFGIRKYR